MLRFRYNTGAFPKDFSYAIDTDAVRGYNHLEYSEESDHFKITTASWYCILTKPTCESIFMIWKATSSMKMRLVFVGVYLTNTAATSWRWAKWSKKLECYYGLGDKPTHFNLKGKRFQNWVTDEYAFGKDRDPLYKAIPLHRPAHQCFLRDFSLTIPSGLFDFGQERRNVTSFGRKEAKWIIISLRPEMTEVVTSYTDLTGNRNYPLWALGTTRASGATFRKSNVREVTQKFRIWRFRAMPFT